MYVKEKTVNLSRSLRRADELIGERVAIERFRRYWLPLAGSRVYVIRTSLKRSCLSGRRATKKRLVKASRLTITSRYSRPVSLISRTAHIRWRTVRVIFIYFYFFSIFVFALFLFNFFIVRRDFSHVRPALISPTDWKHEREKRATTLEGDTHPQDNFPTAILAFDKLECKPIGQSANGRQPPSALPGSSDSAGKEEPRWCHCIDHCGDRFVRFWL